MNIQDTLKPFRKRLTAEAWLRAVILGVLIAACVAVALGAVHLFWPRVIPKVGILLTFGGVFVVGVLSSFLLLYRPTKRTVARRLDSLGMAERVETMLEFEHSNSPAACLQREETRERLRGLHKGDLKLTVSKTLSVLCAASLAVATVLLLVPEIKASPRLPVVDRLNELMNEAELSDEFREELEEIIRELEEKLEESEEEGDVKDALDSAVDRIDDSVDKEVSHKELGDALKRQEDLKELGEAIQKGDQEEVSSALGQLKESMKQDPDKQQEVADQLEEALQDAKTPASNDLREALEGLKEGLRDPQTNVEETVDAAESAINSALDKQQNAQNVGEQMKEELGGLSPSQEGEQDQGEQGEQGKEDGSQGDQNGSQENQNGSEGNGNGSDGAGDASGGENGGSGNSFGAGPNGSNQGSAEGNGQTSMTDQICDPNTGEVKYGEVYASYVADFLAAAERGELPPDVVAAMNAYLESLKNPSKTD